VELQRGLNIGFFRSAEYLQMMRFSAHTESPLEGGSEIKRGEKTAPAKNFAQAMAWLLAEARRGLTIQRYKGLGEMNPEQLWETTMNPAERRLLQVRIEDAVAADSLFTTLMGDQVEPRREFIEQNALFVANLDA